MSVAIKVENLSKVYQLGNFGTGTLSRDLERYWSKIRGKEDPFLKIGEVNDRTVKGESDLVWSLKDINFDIEQGDAVGIIGRNGAGKSTLLKVLSRITAPTTGSVKIRGRIASLLEVGTGFHPELTGRENIYLNGAILGMRKKEITRKFDEIVDFAGVEKYIDTPVKRYSSGMYVRLAFAVAAHLESEIMIVDEVLAVGDADFQKKCLGKMGDVSKGEGRTVLFVSHNMSSIDKLCNKGILLNNGQLIMTGEKAKVINHYLQDNVLSKPVYDLPPMPNASEMPGYAYKLQVEDTNGNLVTELPAGGHWRAKVFFTINEPVEDFVIAFGMTSQMGVNVRTVWSKKATIVPGYYEAILTESDILLAAGSYNLTIGLSSHEKTFYYLEDAGSFTISHLASKNLDNTVLRVSDCGVILNPASVEIKNVNS